MTAAERVVAKAAVEIGYLEKATNYALYSKTANPGSGNWTKYAWDLDEIGTIYNGHKNGYAWCDVFVDWCFITTFGVELGMKLLCQPYGGAGAGCTYSMSYYKAKGQFYKSNPQPGDQIFFTNDGGKTSYHTGLVVKVAGGKVYTIEGNTSSAAGVVPNGGCVRDKSYPLTATYIAGYGRPDWSLVPPDPDSPQEGDVEEMRYNKIADMPTYAQPTITKLVDKGYLGGAGKTKDANGRPADLDLSLDMVRVFVIMDRAGLYD